MAEISRKGNSFTLTVKVWESRGQLRFTGADPDLKAPGIHVPVKNGSLSEASLRYLGNRLGVVWPSAQLVEEVESLDAIPADELQEAVTNLPDEQMAQVAAWVRSWRDENVTSDDPQG